MQAWLTELAPVQIEFFARRRDFQRQDIPRKKEEIERLVVVRSEVDGVESPPQKYLVSSGLF
jgi:hypothetical protein